MPVAAARLAEVGAGDPHPLEVARRGEHPVEQLAVARLQLGALSQCRARVLDPGGEGVADGLELAEVERPWLAP